MSDAGTPTWRYLVPGVLFLGLAVYMLLSGEVALDKRRAMVITRSGDPLIYWPITVVSGTVGLLALRKVWRRIGA